MTFVRYVAGKPPENPWNLTGIITLAKILLRAGKLSKDDAKSVRDVFRWFNKHVPCPPYQEMLDEQKWSEDAVSWFRSNVPGPIERIETLIPILAKHRWAVMRIQTKRVGKIVYRDQYQVVAESPKRR